MKKMTQRSFASYLLPLLLIGSSVSHANSKVSFLSDAKSVFICGMGVNRGIFGPFRTISPALVAIVPIEESGRLGQQGKLFLGGPINDNKVQTAFVAMEALPKSSDQLYHFKAVDRTVAQQTSLEIIVSSRDRFHWPFTDLATNPFQDTSSVISFPINQQGEAIDPNLVYEGGCTTASPQDALDYLQSLLGCGAVLTM